MAKRVNVYDLGIAKYNSMTQKQAIQLFEEKRVCTASDTDAEKLRNLNWLLQVVTS